MTIGVLVRQIREDADLSLRALAQAAGVATSTIHRIERGSLRPTVDTLEHIATAAGTRLALRPEVDYAVSVIGLGLTIRDGLRNEDKVPVVRMAAELAHRVEIAPPGDRPRMLAAEPPPTGDDHWDVFLAALTEWLAVRTGTPTPEWVHKPHRYLDHGWWVTDMKSMRAWEYAGAPASFKIRGVYISRDSLTNV